MLLSEICNVRSKVRNGLELVSIRIIKKCFILDRRSIQGFILLMPSSGNERPTTRAMHLELRVCKHPLKLLQIRKSFLVVYLR